MSQSSNSRKLTIRNRHLKRMNAIRTLMMRSTENRRIKTLEIEINPHFVNIDVNVAMLNVFRVQCSS